jgi:hypothetical protein
MTGVLERSASLLIKKLSSLYDPFLVSTLFVSSLRKDCAESEYRPMR